MNQILITKTEETRYQFGFALNLEHSNFDIVSDFGQFYKIRRYSESGHILLISETGHIAKIVGRTFETAHQPDIFKPEALCAGRWTDSSRTK